MFTTLGAAFLTIGAKLVPSLTSRTSGVFETLMLGGASLAHSVKWNTPTTSSEPATADKNPAKGRGDIFITSVNGHRSRADVQTSPRSLWRLGLLQFLHVFGLERFDLRALLH